MIGDQDPEGNVSREFSLKEGHQRLLKPRECIKALREGCLEMCGTMREQLLCQERGSPEGVALRESYS